MYYTGHEDNDHQNVFSLNEHWTATGSIDISYFEKDASISPISVLGARPMVQNKLSTCIILQQEYSEHVLCSQHAILLLSSSSPSAHLNENDDETNYHPTKSIYSIPTALKGTSVLVEKYGNDMSSDNCTTQNVSLNDENAQMIVPRWKLRQEKRLALCRQRVHLERRLFETSIQQKSQNLSVSMLDQPMKACSIHRDDNNSDSDTYEVLWSALVDVDALPTGFGRMINLETGQVYEGHCVRGLRHGQGRNVWTENEQIYTGEWVKNQRQGRGTHTWPDGRSVTGSWKKGHLHGRVFFSWPNGTTYDGDVVRGQKEGQGTQTWNYGRVYIGQYMAGSAHGVGMLTECNQSKYRGQFQNGSRHGYGIQLWHDKLYEGEWYNNEIHGQGNLLWRNTGATYTGEFKQGLYHGVGIYKEGIKQYTGHWRDGYKEGEGRATWSNGRSYEGSFYRNKRHGYGRMVYTDCSLYIGGWQHGKRCGHGIGIDSNGIVQHCGLWINDRITNISQHTKSDAEKRTCTDDLSISYHDHNSRNHSETLPLDISQCGSM